MPGPDHALDEVSEKIFAKLKENRSQRARRAEDEMKETARREKLERELCQARLDRLQPLLGFADQHGSAIELLRNEAVRDTREAGAKTVSFAAPVEQVRQALLEQCRSEKVSAEPAGTIFELLGRLPEDRRLLDALQEEVRAKWMAAFDERSQAAEAGAEVAGLDFHKLMEEARRK